MVVHCATGVAQVDGDSDAMMFTGLCPKATPRQIGSPALLVSDLSPTLASINERDVPTYRVSRAVRMSAPDPTDRPLVITDTDALAHGAVGGLAAARSKALVNFGDTPFLRDTGSEAPGDKIAMVDASGSVYPLHYPIIMDKYLEASPRAPTAHAWYGAEHLLRIAVLVTIVGGALLSIASAWDKFGALLETRQGSVVWGKADRRARRDRHPSLSVDG